MRNNALVRFCVSLPLICGGLSAYAEPELDIYSYTAGFKFAAADLITHGDSVLRTSGSVVQPVTPHMVPECIIETPSFQSTGPGIVNIELSIKRSFEGALRSGEALSDKSLATIRFERSGSDGREIEFDSIRLARLQRRLHEEEYVRTESLRYIRAEDSSFQRMTVNFQNDTEFENATISLCDFVFNTGLEIESLTVTIIQ